MKTSIKFQHDPMTAKSVYVNETQLELLQDSSEHFLPVSEYNYQVMLRPGEVGISPTGAHRYILGEAPIRIKATRAKVSMG